MADIFLARSSLDSDNKVTSRHLLRLPDVIVDFGVTPALVEDMLASGVCNPKTSNARTSNFHGNLADYSVQGIEGDGYCLVRRQGIFDIV